MRLGGPTRLNSTGWATALLLTLALGPACRRPGPSAPAAPPALLPERIGLFPQTFLAGPLVTDEVATRRTYTRGAARVDVTLALFPMDDAGYARWVRTSRESFPQATLDVPPDEANGFYQCAEKPDPGCSLLVQLRSGVHVEIRAAGDARRADLDLVAAGLPLRALAVDARPLQTVAQHPL